MTNRCTLAQLRDMTPEQVDTLPIGQLAALLEDAADAKALAKHLDDILHASLVRRYAGPAAAMRREQGKDTGRVTLAEDGYVIRADLPKKVEWDDDKLAEAEATLAAMGEPVREYIRVKRIVMEGAFEKWPTSLRAIFTPARTVGAGRPTFTVERAKKEAA